MWWRLAQGASCSIGARIKLPASVVATPSAARQPVRRVCSELATCEARRRAAEGGHQPCSHRLDRAGLCAIAGLCNAAAKHVISHLVAATSHCSALCGCRPDASTRVLNFAQAWSSAARARIRQHDICTLPTDHLMVLQSGGDCSSGSRRATAAWRRQARNLTFLCWARA